MQRLHSLCFNVSGFSNRDQKGGRINLNKIFMKGNEALGEAAIRAGCRYFFGYPITPQSELPHYLAKHLPKYGGVYLQSESEVSAINMVHGASGAGARVMTSSSGPGISLKSEGISFLACAELPSVIVNIMRGGPGLGNIQPTQADYSQATRGGGHGDYRIIVLAPASVQEIVDLTFDAFDLADRYRTPVMILGDGILGLMMEPVELPEMVNLENLAPKPWATTGKGSRKRVVITSLYLPPEKSNAHNQKLQEKYALIQKNETRVDTYLVEDADCVIVAFGIAARIAQATVDLAREEGIQVGLIRPVTLWPFPHESVAHAAKKCKFFLTVELNMGQMVDDVRLAANGKAPVAFYGVTGGVIPTPKELLRELKKLEVETNG